MLVSLILMLIALSVLVAIAAGAMFILISFVLEGKNDDHTNP